ncbi:ABC transporter substrate-binding protein [Halotalea alkalilenta]|uniref:ABC transporter substrate-binding protein n=1 Tax=Halotalea alkalilenta TaxID=376489 RepID=A0A172YAT7_9GAMM|nr:ABC transporter substrate-binding protein [Halotalea alkalilenta]
MHSPFGWTRLLAFCLPIALVSVPDHARASELTIAQATAPAALDPGFLREAATLVDNVFDTLVMRDDQMRLAPGLATEWRVIDDQTWEFELRPGVKFHNGEPFDAEAVKFTFDRILDPAANAPTISYVRTISEVEIVDADTVRFHTTGPDPLLPSRLSRYPAYIVPPGYLREAGEQKFASAPVGTGPYRVAEFVRDDHLTMVANPDYWRGAPELERVIWRPIPEATARVAALLSGEVQLAESIPADLAQVIESNPELRLDRVENGGLTLYLGLKSDEPPLDDPRVREALSLAIDRQAVVSRLLRGFATVHGSQASPLDHGYLELPAPDYDPERARQLLAEAGYGDGFEIRMQAPRRYNASADVGQYLAQAFGQIGVKVSLEIPEWSVYTQQVPSGSQAPIYMLGWGSTQTLDADAALYPILRSGEPYSTVRDAELDQLLDRSRQMLDEQERIELLAAVQQRVVDQRLLLTLYQEDSLYGVANGVRFEGRADARIPLFDLGFNP